MNPWLLPCLFVLPWRDQDYTIGKLTISTYLVHIASVAMAEERRPALAPPGGMAGKWVDFRTVTIMIMIVTKMSVRRRRPMTASVPNESPEASDRPTASGFNSYPGINPNF
jgi:hypothetical protein